MSILNIPQSLFPLQLNKDITRQIKRGHRWVFAGNITAQANDKFGIYCLKYKQDVVAIGIYQPDTQLKFRVLCTDEDWFFKKNNLTKTLEIYQDTCWQKAVQIRNYFDLKSTNSFRLINGEGDGFPGLTIDIYGDTAVIKHDHPLMETLWNSEGLSQRLRRDLPQLKTIYLKRRNDVEEKGRELFGELPPETQFLENGLIFASQIRDAAKTGFFLDQRNNRHTIRQFAKDKSVLNLFSYTGGFSIAAAAGGAKQVTSVDIARPAIEAVKRNFELNQLKTPHEDLATDAFEYVKDQIVKKSKFDLVITDPPSFAPNEKSVPQATAAYVKIFTDSLKLVAPGGLFAASSCSSHIHFPAFMEITQEAFSKAKLRGTILNIGGQPIDHPYPMAMEELRYLKFALFRID